jgi:hypothetical protein
MNKPTPANLPHALPIGSNAEREALRAAIQEAERGPSLWWLYLRVMN